MTITYYDENGDEFTPPMRWVICDTCEGEGRGPFGNRGFVFTTEDMHEDPEFAQDYASGFYDQPCTDCSGTGKVQVVDYERCTEEVREIIDEADAAIYEMRAVEEMERRMGA